MAGDVEIKGEEDLEGAVLWQLTELTDPGIARVWRQNRQLCHTYRAMPRAMGKEQQVTQDRETFPLLQRKQRGRPGKAGLLNRMSQPQGPQDIWAVTVPTVINLRAPVGGTNQM